MREKRLGANAAGRHRPLLRARRNLIHISSKSCVFSNPSLFLFNVCSFRSSSFFLSSSLFFFLLLFLLIFVYSLLLFSSSFLSIYFLPLSSPCSLFSECWIVNVSDPASWLNMFLDLYVRSTNCIATNTSYKRNDNFY